ncbi:VWA domain-containing protein, partial [Ruminococcus sp.]|uniref:vWA domain-containing protein n=1 Tax=Ruminococcus sp. TaxID=41978 RepID=UPI0025E3C5E3
MKKIFSVFLLSIICLLLTDNLVELDAFAVEKYSVAGVEVSISSDKEEYAYEDDVNISFIIDNKTADDLNDIEWELELPNGFKVKDGSLSANDINVNAGQSYQGNAVLVMDPDATTTSTVTTSANTTSTTTKQTTNEKTDSAKTGDNSNIGLFITLLTIAMIIAVVSSKRIKKVLKLLSLMLCFVFIATSNPINAFADETQDITAKVDREIKLGGEQFKVGFSVKYKIDVKEITQEALYWQSLLGIPHDIDLTDNNGNNIPDALESMLSEDSDRDSIPDIYEKIYKTDPENEDTDGDKLNDGYEMFILGTDPLNSDSDGNGISDADEDYDKDGLSNLIEFKATSHPLNADTDGDGLNDNDEINKYKTSPIKKDTDSDGLNDNDEIKYNMDPLKEDTIGDGVKDGDRIYPASIDGDISDNQNVSASIDVDLKGDQLESLNISKIPDEDVFLNSTIPGYIGNGYELTVNDDFDTATLKFELDPNLFNDPSFDPAIYYWNSEDQSLTEVENQKVEGNTVSAILEHFSSYIILDRRKYYQTVKEYEIIAPTNEELQNKKFDVYLTLDESGSISASDFSKMKNCCIELIDYLNENDKVGIVTFDHFIRNDIGLSDTETAKNSIETIIQNYGSTALYSAINKSINNLNNTTESSRIVIALTDGYDNMSEITYNEAATNAQNSHVVVYTIGVGSYVNTAELKELAHLTGGQYYPASDFNELSAIFERVIENADLYKDSDEDGISDYHEKCIANGKLKLGTGATVPKLGSLSYLNEDSDADNLLDGEEIEIKSRNVNGKTVYYCYMYSNPCVIDTDDDELNDFVENYAGLDPLVSGLLPGTLNSSIPTNPFVDWLDLIRTRSWNYIHNLVEEDIVQKNIPRVQSEVPLRSSNGRITNRIDLYDWTTHGIWDVKPASYQFSPRREAGLTQLSGYESLANQPQNGMSVHIGGAEIGMGGVIIRSDYTIEYVNNLNGLVTYHFVKRSTVPVPVVVPAPATNPIPATNPVPATDSEPAFDPVPAIEPVPVPTPTPAPVEEPVIVAPTDE